MADPSCGDDGGPKREQRRLILSEDLPLTVLTAVVTALVMGAVGLGKEWALVGVALSPLVADAVKNAVAARGWGRKRIVGLTALLLLLDRVRGARAATERTAPTKRAIVVTAAVSSCVAIVLVTAPEAARGKSLFSSGKRTTLFGPTIHRAADTSPPRLGLPAGARRRSARPAAVTWTATAVDDRDGTRSIACSPPSGSTFALGSTHVVCTASDRSGNRARAGFDVVLTPPDAPILRLPDTVRVSATGPDGARVEFRASAEGPEGGAVRIRCAPASGTTFRLGATTVACRAGTGAAAASGSFRVVVRDAKPPVLSLPAALEVTAPTAAGRTVAFRVTARDEVDGQVAAACEPASGSTFAAGTTSVTCTAADTAGNRRRGNFAVTVRVSAVDAPPQLAVADVEREATSRAGAVVDYTATATDDRDGTIQPDCSPRSGSTFPLGPTTVRCSAVDSGGHRATAEFKVTVVDTTPPVLALPPSLTREAPSPAGVGVPFEASATDLVDGVVDVSCAPRPGSVFTPGTTPVSCTASDRSGNRANGSFTVEVTVAPDTKPPVLTLTDARAEATSPAGAPVGYAASANDAVDGTLVPRCDPSSGSVFPLGPSTVHCSVADAAGNRASGTLTVTVVDTTGPRIVGKDPVVAEAATRRGAAVRYRVTGVDLVDGRVAVACSPKSGSIFALGSTTVTCTAADKAGNVTSRRFRVEVRDTRPPLLTLPADFSVRATSPGADWQATLSFDASARDLVDGLVPVTCDPASGTVVHGFTETIERTVACTATDRHGNTATGSFVVTLVVPPPPD